jgi:ABC-type sulfate/molybdate transport systems ATPase subunit
MRMDGRDRQRVAEMLTLLQLEVRSATGYAVVGAAPTRALGRALAVDPQLLLLDDRCRTSQAHRIAARARALQRQINHRGT